jgi:predicted dinucleotide-binding enzyme
MVTFGYLIASENYAAILRHRTQGDNTMRIAIIGAGSVGKKLGVLAHSAGYEVIFGVRSPRDLGHFTVTSVAGAVLESDFILLAIPFAACADCLVSLAKDIAGKIVVDVTNPLNPDWSPLLLGETNSAAQSISALLPGSHVVKAFNTVFADMMSVDRISRVCRAHWICTKNRWRFAARAILGRHGASQHRHRNWPSRRHERRLHL